MISKQESFAPIAEILQQSTWADIAMVGMKQFMENTGFYANVMADNYNDRLKEYKKYKKEGNDLINKGQSLKKVAQEYYRHIESNIDHFSSKVFDEKSKECRELLRKAKTMILEGKRISKIYETAVKSEQSRKNLIEEQLDAAKLLIKQGELIVQKGKTMDLKSKMEMVDGGNRMIAKGNALIAEIQNENNQMSDWTILYKWQHYAGSTSNRTPAGTIARAAVDAFLDSPPKINPEKLQLTNLILKTFEIINRAAAIKEKVISGTGSQIALKEAMQKFNNNNEKFEFKGHKQDISISMLHLTNYLELLQSAKECLEELYKRVASEIKKQQKSSICNDSSETILGPFKQSIHDLEIEMMQFGFECEDVPEFN